MNKEELKKLVCDAIDQNQEGIHNITDHIYKNPELGYKEFETTELVSEYLHQLGLDVDKNIAITGCIAKAKSKNDGPNIAVMGELDSVICKDHKDAGKDGASHSCGHHIQIASMLGCAVGIIKSGVLEQLAGSVEFMAVPAEEFIEIEYRSKLIDEGKIKYAGGKQELLYKGYFDNVDISMMIHSDSLPNNKKALIGAKSNGFIGKKVSFIGKEAHAGGAPHLGINALNAAMLAMNNINSQRETFKDDDHIRIHPIITKGGDIVNVVPADVRMETYVRGSSIEGMSSANKKVNNCLKAGALATGAKVEIHEIPGYLPLVPNNDLDNLFKDNIMEFIPESDLLIGGSFSGSTDFGDISHIMPSIHPMIGGVSGSLHTREFSLIDRDMAYIIPAKVMAMTIIDLLYENAEEAKRIINNFTPVMTKEEYLKFLEDSSKKDIFSY